MHLLPMVTVVVVLVEVRLRSFYVADPQLHES